MKRGENGSRLHFLCGSWCCEKLAFSFPGLSGSFKVRWMHFHCHLSNNTIIRLVSFRLLATSLHIYPFLSSPGSFLHLVLATLQACCLSSRAQRFCGTLDVPLVGRRRSESLRAREKKSCVGEVKDGIDGEKMSCIFMFAACPFDVHTKTTWGPQQWIPVANMTVGLAATLHTWDSTPPLFPPCPAVLTTIPSLSSTFMASLTSHYAPLHLACQSTFGTPGPSLLFLPARLTVMPMVLETTLHHETGTQYATEINTAHLHSTF